MSDDLVRVQTAEGDPDARMISVSVSHPMSAYTTLYIRARNMPYREIEKLRGALRDVLPRVFVPCDLRFSPWEIASIEQVGEWSYRVSFGGFTTVAHNPVGILDAVVRLSIGDVGAEQLSDPLISDIVSLPDRAKVRLNTPHCAWVEVDCWSVAFEVHSKTFYLVGFYNYPYAKYPSFSMTVPMLYPLHRARDEFRAIIQTAVEFFAEDLADDRVSISVRPAYLHSIRFNDGEYVRGFEYVFDVFHDLRAVLLGLR
jgi:hypothetical protein